MTRADQFGVLLYYCGIVAGAVGVVFAGVWALIVYLRGEVKRRQERGLLPGQQRPPTD